MIPSDQSTIDLQVKGPLSDPDLALLLRASARFCAFVGGICEGARSVWFQAPNKCQE